MKTQARLFRISGRVQGVGFRFFAERTAVRLGLCGYAKNLFDGRVEIYAIGNAPLLESFKEVLKRGPSVAQVDGVTEEEAEVLSEYENDFTIERDE